MTFKYGDKVRLKDASKTLWRFITYLPEPDSAGRDIVVQPWDGGSYCFGKAANNVLVPKEFEVGKKYKYPLAYRPNDTYLVVGVDEEYVLGWRFENGNKEYRYAWSTRTRNKQYYEEVE